MSDDAFGGVPDMPDEDDLNGLDFDEIANAFNDKDIQKIAWTRYGFRVGAAGGSTALQDTGIKGIPKELPQGAKGLQMDTYNRLIQYLKEGV